MISERTIAQRYHSLWQTVTPFSEKLVRAANVRASRFARPVGTQSGGRRALIAEIAFEICLGWTQDSLAPPNS